MSLNKLPRTRILANKNLHKNVRTAKSNLKKEMSALGVICDKYNVKELTFRSVQFITSDGTITTIEHNTIKGNINHGIFLIESPCESVTLDKIYDIVKIKEDKKKRDFQKKIDAQNKSKPEMERLNQQIIKDLQTLKDKSIVDTDDTKIIIDDPVENIIDKIDNITVEDLVNNSVENIIEAAETTDDLVETVVDNSSATIQKAKKIAKTTGNKFFRNFMKDIRGKFKLSFQDEYEYCEFRKEATDLIVEGVNIHKINISNDSSLSYYIVIGNMQMKRIAIKQIDPAYGADDIINEHNEFMNKVQKKDDDVPDLVNIE
jgi:hypothetical protein